MTNHPTSTPQSPQRPAQDWGAATDRIFVPVQTDHHRVYVSLDAVTGKVVEIFRHPTTEDRQNGHRNLVQVHPADRWKYLDPAALLQLAQAFDEYTENTNRSD